jgi:hypothetical protein
VTGGRKGEKKGGQEGGKVNKMRDSDRKDGEKDER